MIDFLLKKILYICYMKFFEKYPSLNQKETLMSLLEKNLYATMILENQKVSRAKIKKIVADILDKKSKSNKVFFN
ncbi:hypothetical protein DTW91_08325 [Chryseobacterium sp. SC28]|nr:hypothetical protein DTW91_08325 [Chryseobacterium sp. SC28]